ncbi:MAG: hypothetical protein ABI137_05435 [Antricoccus sp.]
MGRRSAGDNDQQLSVADLLRAASRDRQPRRSRRHGDSNLATVRDDPQQSEVALPAEQVGAPSANPKEIQHQAGDLATPPSKRVGPDPKQRRVTEQAGEQVTSLPDGVSAANDSDQISELAIDPVLPLPDRVSLDPRRGQVSESASDLPIPPQDGVSAGQHSDQTVEQERERRIETTGAQALEVLDVDIAAKNADSQQSSALAFLSAADPAEHRLVPTATPRSNAGPADELDTAEVPVFDERDASAESSLSTAKAESAEVEPMLTMALPTPAETEPGPLARSDLVDHSAATSWLLAIGEVVLAIVIGAGLAYVFRLLWDIYPYVAAVIAPLVICGVIGVVGLARKRLRQGAIPLPLLLVILFITGLLVVLPAAWVMTTR